MSYVLTFLAIWTAVSFPCGIGFCWLIKTGRIGFAPIEDRTEFSHDWQERRS